MKTIFKILFGIAIAVILAGVIFISIMVMTGKAIKVPAAEARCEFVVSPDPLLEQVATQVAELQNSVDKCVAAVPASGDKCETKVVFGPEEAFPAKVVGPAIAEIWNPDSGLCALVKINSGEILDWPKSGAWWQADSQENLNIRWPHHEAEYVAKSGNENCKVFTSAKDVPTP